MAVPMACGSDVRDRMDEHVFDLNMVALFTIMTPGEGEDGWTPKVNGMIICSDQIGVVDLGFPARPFRMKLATSNV